jgi:hypothetical protein
MTEESSSRNLWYSICGICGAIGGALPPVQISMIPQFSNATSVSLLALLGAVPGGIVGYLTGKYIGCPAGKKTLSRSLAAGAARLLAAGVVGVVAGYLGLVAGYLAFAGLSLIGFYR